MSDARVQVQNAKGEPLRNVTIKLEQTRHQASFGCNLFSFGRCETPEREDAYRSYFSSLFNYCTVGFYWAAYESIQGQPNYAYTDRVLDWTNKQGLVCKGHPLVWDHPAASPRWLPDDPGQLALLVAERVKTLVTRFRGRIDYWDVINEATHVPQRVNHTVMAAWGAELGPVTYSTEPLRIARAANPHAMLLVNDYRTDDAYFQLLSRLRQEHRPLFDAVGIQSHMHDGLWPLHKLYSLCSTYSKLRVPIHFTEPTLLSGAKANGDDQWETSTAEGEEAQAEAAAAFYTMLFAHPAVQAVTWWDFSDYQAWRKAPAGLLRSDMSPKPAYERLHQLLKREWWSRATAKTDEMGSCHFRVFHGTHQVTAADAGQKAVSGQLTAGHDTPNELTLTL